MKEGDAAPDIRLETDSGEAFRLSSLKGKRVVLYFYPKADTPGCTAEACEFRDGMKAFARKGVAVVGISPDKPASSWPRPPEKAERYGNRVAAWPPMTQAMYTPSQGMVTMMASRISARVS